MKRPAGQTLLAGCALGVLAFVAVVTAPAPVRSHEPFASTDYRSDGYRAWAALLAGEGIVTTRFVLRPIELDRRIDTLISAQPTTTSATEDRTAADLGALAAWVRAGGRLVYVGRSATLRAVERRVLALPIVLPHAGARGALRGPFAGDVPALRALGAKRMLCVKQAGVAELADGNGAIVVRYPLGRGEVVAVVDGMPFTNANIAGAENARLAYLVGRPRRGGVVAFDDALHGALIDRPWYRALPIPVRVSLVIGAAALVLALIGSALRGSPPMRLPAAREPGSGEFIDALAALYERTAARSAVCAILVRDALAVAARKAGLPDDARPELLLARVGDAAGGDAIRRLALALEAPVATDTDLLAHAKLAHLVRKDCSYGGNGDGRRAAFAGRTRPDRRR